MPCSVWHVQVMIDDSHLLAASEDRTWTIWDMNTEKLSKIYRAAMGAVRGVAMGPDQVGGARDLLHTPPLCRSAGRSGARAYWELACCHSMHMAIFAYLEGACDDHFAGHARWQTVIVTVHCNCRGSARCT